MQAPRILTVVRGLIALAVWRTAAASAPAATQRDTQRLVACCDLGVAPDASRIVFVSNRTGSKELWIANNDGSNQTQLTFFNGPSLGSPRWSPDGKSILFVSNRSGNQDVWVVAASGGEPRQLTDFPTNEGGPPQWSPDGSEIYFTSPKDAAPFNDLWKVPAAGGAPTAAVRVRPHATNDCVSRRASEPSV